VTGVYETPANEFCIELLRQDVGQNATLHTGNQCELLFVLQGQLSLHYAVGARLALKRGESALIPACMGEIQYSAETASQVFRVKMPNA
jgi:mannose-6-phosphate isomerase class I